MRETMTTIKIQKKTTTKGFDNPQFIISWDPNMAEMLSEELGVSSWDKVPNEIRKNGRPDVGKLYGEFSPAEFVEDGDFSAVCACIKEARRLTGVKIEEKIREL